MITAIEIENFKAIGKRVRVELKPLTLIFGPNSAGKSSIVQAIQYAREIFERGNFDADRTVAGGDVVDLGGFRQFVHGGNEDLPVRIRFDLDLQTSRLPPYTIEELIGEFGDAEIENSINRLTSAWAAVQLRWNATRQEVHN